MVLYKPKDKFFLLVGLICSLCFVRPAPSGSGSSKTFKPFKAVILASTKNRVKLRIGPGTNSVVATVLTNSFWVWVIDQKGNWYSVSSLKQGKIPKYQYWVYKKYVTNTENLLSKKPILKDRNFLVFKHYIKLDIRKCSPNDSFEVLKQDPSTVTINIGGRARRYLKPALPAEIKTVKWDIANNIPVLTYSGNQAFFKYYHQPLRFLFSRPIYFLVIPVVFLIFAFVAFSKKRATTLFVVFSVFLLFGSCQQGINKNYRSDYYKQVIELKIQKAFNSNNYKKFFAAEIPEGKFLYTASNYFTVLVLIGFIIAVIFFIYYSFQFFLYISVPHPAEKHLKAYQKGKISKEVTTDKIHDTMHKLGVDAVPPTWKVNIHTKRLEALTKLIKAEEEFLRSMIELIKAKS